MNRVYVAPRSPLTAYRSPTAERDGLKPTLAHARAHRSPLTAYRSPVARWLGCALMLFVTLAGAWRDVGAQTPQELELLRQNPQLVRQLLQSGLTPEQIRQRLEAAGFSGSLLDEFLEPTAGQAGLTVSDQQLQALQALGLTDVRAQGLEAVVVDTGFSIRRFPPAPPDTGLTLFGINVFRRQTTQFQPTLSGPVPPTYRVGPGDELVLVITGDVELVHQLTVTREGFILIPQVGQIFVNSLTMEQLTRVLRERLGRSYSGIRAGTTRFDVTIARLRTNQVYVIGEVLQPGAYQLASVATVLNALYAAGGPTERGNFRAITVQRGADTAVTLDLYEYLLAGSTAADVVLQQGDVVFVPVRGPRAKVTGAVVRPAIYELRPDETLSDAIRMAGGFRAEADQRRIAVHRVLPVAERGPGPMPRAVVDVALVMDANDGSDGRDGSVGIPPFRLENGDSVVVDSIIDFAGSLYVTVAGMVNKPGRFPWSPGMTLRNLITLARGPRVGADLREAEVARLPRSRVGGALAEPFRVPLDSSYLLERDPTGEYLGPAGVSFPAAGTAAETPLEPYDQVTMFRQPEFELQRAVHVTGEVAFPGTYALTRKDERLSDLVRRAGGVLPTAYVAGARFYRILERPVMRDREEGTSAVEVQASTERVNVELEVALRSPGAARDVVLQPSDSLHVPEYNPTVTVEGAVNSPTAVLYREGAGLDYYIANAGGYARGADKGRVSVRYANGSARVKSKFLFFSSAPKPGPGSVVTVPSEPKGEPFDVTQFLATIAQLAASAVAIVAISTR